MRTVYYVPLDKCARVIFLFPEFKDCTHDACDLNNVLSVTKYAFNQAK